MPVLSLLLLSLVPLAMGALGPTSNLVISSSTAGPDGASHEVVTVNGQYPSPMITAKKNQAFRLNVQNNIQSTDPEFTNDTSIHWHGFFQNHTTWADGVAMVSQCPISSGRSFLYNFTAPGQAGTFWYHSHMGLQYCDGLRGPLIVYDDNDPHKHLYDVDNESTVLTLADWYDAGIAGSLPPGPALDAVLFNGKGRSASSNSSVPYEIIEVEHGKAYRIRALSMSCDPNFLFSIDGHNMTVIEADGQNTEPLTVDQMQIFAAQRYSFVLNATQPIGNYWIRALPNTNNRTDFTNGRNLAILRYKGANNTLPTTPIVNATNPLVETNLHALEDPAAPGLPEDGGANITDVFYFGFDRANGTFNINGTEYNPNALTTPVLLQMLNGVPPQSLLPQGSVYFLPRNVTVEIMLRANQSASPPGGPHPFHLHGHAFSVVRSAGNTTANYKNPVRRDVVSTGNVTNDDFATIRFNTNNPGPWIMHCHIDFHLNVGLALVFAEGTDQDVISSNPIPAEVTQICAAPASTQTYAAIANKPFNAANTTNTTVVASSVSSLSSLLVSSSVALPTSVGVN